MSQKTALKQVQTFWDRTQNYKTEDHPTGIPLTEAQNTQAALLLRQGFTPGQIVSTWANGQMAQNWVDKHPGQPLPANVSGSWAAAKNSGYFPSTVQLPAPTPKSAPATNSPMPVNTTNGWTGSSILPSYSVLSRILGSASGSGNPSAPATPANAPAPRGSPLYGAGSGTLPSTPSRNPPGWGGNSAGYNGSGAPGGRAGMVDPSLNPQQAYAGYLQQRGFADTNSPQQSAFNTAAYQYQRLTDADPFGLYSRPDQSTIAGAIGKPTGNAFLEQAKFQSDLANRMFATASPYSYSYGTPSAQAPTAQPAGGYIAGYNNQYNPGWTSGGNSNYAGQGFGF